MKLRVKVKVSFLNELPVKWSYVAAVIVFIIFIFNNRTYIHSEMINGLRANDRSCRGCCFTNEQFTSSFSRSLFADTSHCSLNWLKKKQGKVDSTFSRLTAYCYCEWSLEKGDAWRRFGRSCERTWKWHKAALGSANTSFHLFLVSYLVSSLSCLGCLFVSTDYVLEMLDVCEWDETTRVTDFTFSTYQNIIIAQKCLRLMQEKQLLPLSIKRVLQIADNSSALPQLSRPPYAKTALIFVLGSR